MEKNLGRYSTNCNRSFSSVGSLEGFFFSFGGDYPYNFTGLRAWRRGPNEKLSLTLVQFTVRYYRIRTATACSHSLMLMTDNDGP